jgi:signal transduction histidine kinase
MNTLRVLVVDDEPGMRKGSERAIRDFQIAIPETTGETAFEVTTAESGEKAIELVEANGMPDVVLLDYKLPGISGLETLERLRALKTDMVVIMVTAYASLQTAISAVKGGAYDFLAKPFTPQELRSALKKAAESLTLVRRARQLAIEKRQVRFQFISVLAHELKAPLSAIEGYLHIIKDHAAGDDPAAYDKMVTRSLLRAQYMRKMISDLLDLTGLESGKKVREVGEVDLWEVARLAAETSAPAAAERGIEIDLHDGAPVVMTADAGEIEIMFNNLVGNAVKYNVDGGRVDVAIEDRGEEVTLAVSDTGIGLAEEDLARLFTEFTRIKNEKTRNILGSGLGLSIVKKIASLYDGSVSVKSSAGSGSTFTVVLKRGAAKIENADADKPGSTDDEDAD